MTITGEELEDLESRMLEYSEGVREAVEHRDRVALDAAWGIVQSGWFLAGVAGGVYIVRDWLGGHWYSDLIGGVIGLVVGGAASLYTNKMRMKEIDELPPVPLWRGK